MTNEYAEDLKNRIAYAEGQFEIFKTYALYWQAMVVSGAYKLRQTQRGREPNEEEKARGEVIGFRDQTDEEKLQDAISTMQRHIHIMTECNDTLYELRKQLSHDSSRNQK